MTPNSDLQLIHKESGDSMTTAKLQSARLFQNILPVYFQRFLPNYNNSSAHNHNLRHQDLRLPMTRKEYYVQSTKYQLFKDDRLDSKKKFAFCLITSYFMNK